MNETEFSSIATDSEFEHLRGNSARSHNIDAACGIAEVIRSTLGPAGLDKMLISSKGTATVTNDGETVLKKMEIEHPAAKSLIEVAKAQAEEVGDGTTSAVLIASELLYKSEMLLESGLSPAVIINGYQHALDIALDVIDESALQVDSDSEELQHIAESSLAGKGVSNHVEALVPLVIDATEEVTVENIVDVQYLNTVSVAGKNAGHSELIHGAAIDANPCHEGMPAECPEANVVLLQQDFVVSEPETEVNTRISRAEQREGFIEREEGWIMEAIDHLESIGSNVILCDGRINEIIEQRLASRGILALEHIDRTDVEFEFLREITGAVPVTDPMRVTHDQLGSASVSQNELIYVENPATHGVTLVCRGATKPIAAEVERNINDAINVVAQSVTDGRILAGGGAPEIEIATKLRDHATGVDDRTQLGIEAYADALEVIPRTLARNAGIDPIDVLVMLRSEHDSDQPSIGLDVRTGEIDDLLKTDVLQPAHVTEQIIYTATKAAAILLKIDEILVAPHSSYENEGDN